MNLKEIKKKYEDVKFALTIPYGSDLSWDKLSDNNFLKFLEIFQITLYVLIFSTPVLSLSVLLFQFIKEVL